MNKQGKTIVILLIILSMLQGVHAAGLKKLAQTSMKWLSIPVGARPISLGSAYFTSSGNAEDLFWNPAGTGFLNAFQVYFSHLPWIADIRQEVIGAALPVEGLGTFSVGLRYVDFGTLQGTQLASNSEGWEYTDKFTPLSYQIGLGFSQRITDRFSYGIFVSYAREELGTVTYAPVMTGSIDNPVSAETSMNLFNLDFGVLYYTGFRDLRLGMTLKNFSQEKGYENVDNSIPMDLRVGLAMNLLSLFWNENLDHNLTMSVDLSHPRDYSERLHFGFEYSYSQMVALRMGYMSNYDEQDLTFGAGILPNFKFAGVRLGLDYAYMPFGVFESLQTFSFSFFIE
jgi:hypothetical protein